MIVVNKKPNITHLPYLDGNRNGVFSFSPGQNEIDPTVWQAVKKAAGDERMQAHFGKFLKPIGEEKGVPADPATLNADDFIDLINGAMALDLLDQYAKAETARKGGARKSVLEAIAKQSAEIRSIEDAKKGQA